ncbi:hypothetical protein CSE16_11580 [Solibacillus sp. R5-41]|uniref:hypothetical protein n=1 Tax=Solibacillus sp. R5-41 TaxID=2048654 RepID=UPI000C128491|nr:hypothetical protein [Solibacillus sp. R5-41]ATP40638.1 hypothetical protein CSE16_11580 [Solibacillus sp. R5-41]
MQVLSRKFSIALISIVVCSFILTVMSIGASQEFDLTFGTLWMTFIILSAPMFLIVGVLSSFIYWKYIRSTRIRFICYVVTGTILIIPYSNYYFQGSDALRFALLGACGAMIFFGIEWLFNRYIFRGERQQKRKSS